LKLRGLLRTAFINPCQRQFSLAARPNNLANDRDKVRREESSQFPELIGLVVVAVLAE
jgi:hypothetical protein